MSTFESSEISANPSLLQNAPASGEKTKWKRLLCYTCANGGNTQDCPLILKREEALGAHS